MQPKRNKDYVKYAPKVQRRARVNVFRDKYSEAFAQLKAEKIIPANVKAKDVLDPMLPPASTGGAPDA